MHYSEAAGSSGGLLVPFIRIRVGTFHMRVKIPKNEYASGFLKGRAGFSHKSPLLGRFCGTKNIPKHIVSTGNRMIIINVSNHMENSGFVTIYASQFQ